MCYFSFVSSFALLAKHSSKVFITLIVDHVSTDVFIYSFIRLCFLHLTKEYDDVCHQCAFSVHSHVEFYHEQAVLRTWIELFRTLQKFRDRTACPIEPKIWSVLNFNNPKVRERNLRYVSCSVSFVAVPLKKKNSRIWSNYSICSFILKNDDNASAVLTFEELRAKRLSFDRKPNDRKWKSIRTSIETSLNEFKRLFDEKNNSNNKSRSSSSFLAFSYIAKVSKRLGFLCRSNNWFLVCGESEKEREITKVDYQSLWCAHTHTHSHRHI